MCDRSDEAKFVTAFLVVYGLPAVCATASKFLTVQWAKKLQEDAVAVCLVQKKELLAQMATAQETKVARMTSDLKRRVTTLGSSSRDESLIGHADRSDDDTNSDPKAMIALSYFRQMLNKRHHFWDLPASIAPHGMIRTYFGIIQLPPGLLEDFLFYSCNCNTILGKSQPTHKPLFLSR